jgi:hypothetical protein
MSRLGAVVLFAAAATSIMTARAADAHILSGSPLDGRWTFTWTPSMVKSQGGVPSSLAGRHMVELRDGQLIQLLPHPVLRRARFTVSGDVATFVFLPGAVGVVPGRPYKMRWSI